MKENLNTNKFYAIPRRVIFMQLSLTYFAFTLTNFAIHALVLYRDHKTPCGLTIKRFRPVPTNLE